MEIDSLKEYFDIEQVEKGWRIHCKKCKKGWFLEDIKEPSIGAILKLLDHAHSHS